MEHLIIKLKNYLNSLEIFTLQEIDEFIGLSSYEVLKKNDYFIQEGSVCKKVGFVGSGIFRTYYLSSDAEDVTYCLTFPDSLLSAYSSLITQQKTVENIQAITRAELLTFPKQELDRLVTTHQNWLLFMKQIAESQYIEMEKRIFQLQKEKASNRYRDLLEKHPDYIQNIPLQYLASYLGITQRHLSRLRREIAF